MIPLRDINPVRTVPLITILIIVANAAVFLYELSLGRRLDAFINLYGTVPCEITLECPIPARLNIPVWATIFTSMFMHGGWLHIAGNMLYLWVFGDNVEDNFGHGKFVIFYLICGLAASFAQIAVDPSSPIPSLGASGAIAGVLGAYIVMFPHNRVRNLVTLGFFITTIELPALVVIGFWIVLQIISQYTASFSHTASSGGVAYMAHIGGFVAGLLLSFVFRSRRTRGHQPPFYDPYER